MCSPLRSGPSGSGQHLAWLGNAGQEPAATLPSVWDDLTSVYLDALRDPGWTGSDADVKQSMATACAVRHGWVAEHLLAMATSLPDEAQSISEHVDFLAELMHSIR